MNSIILKAYAKLNLSLNVSSNVRNGFHRVKFLNCELNLADKIKIKKIKQEVNKKFYISCGRKKCRQINRRILVKCKWQENDCYDTSCPDGCLAFLAAKLLQKKFPKKINGIEITIDKKIPVKAGLGGGSADAGAVLRGMNKLYNLRLSQKELIKIATKISSDACYSVTGGLCKVEGIGEKITPLKIKHPLFSSIVKWGLRGIFLVIVVPKIKKPSTKWCYQNLDEHKIGKNLDKYKKLLLTIKSDHYPLSTIHYLHNDFEPLIFSHFPQIRKIKEKLLTTGAENAILAGSGLAVVGFFREKPAQNKISNLFGNKFNCIFTKIK